MGTFKEDQNRISKARLVLDRTEKNFYKAKLHTHKIDNPLLLRRRKLAYIRAQANLKAQLNELYRLRDVKAVAAELDAQIPVLFLPVRLETRFVKVSTTTELWVRIYPDDIHVHSHEEHLTDKEYSHGKQYWINLLAANQEQSDLSKTIKQTAWEDLSGKAGVQRALWIVKKTKPANWVPDFMGDKDLLEFPNHLESKSHDWTRAPRTQLLPDKFAVNIIKSSKVVATKIGNNIPDTVFLGPDPFLAEEAFKKDDKGISFDESFEWISKFDKAVEQGLGLKFPLNPRWLNRGKIDRLVVFGIMSSASPAEGQKMLEKLLENHHYSKKGLSFLPQMSPTNNTEESESVYKKNEDYLPRGYYDGSSIQNMDTAPNADGNNFAEYLGINGTLFNEVNHANTQEFFEATAMNKVLYPSTVGNFIEVFANPVVKEANHNKLREFFTNYVTATGPMPSIRVGDQPYGTLITSDMRRWKDRDSFTVRLSIILRKLQSKYNQITKNKVKHIGKTGDPSEIMLNILGLNAGSISFGQRMAHLPDFLLTLSGLSNMLNLFKRHQNDVVTYLGKLGFRPEKNGFPIISNLVFYNFLNPIHSNYLIDRKTPKKNRHLDSIGRSGNYIEWLSNVKNIKDLENHNIGGTPPRTVLYLLMHFALLQEIKSVSESIFSKAKVPFKRAAFEKSLYNFDAKLHDINDWEVLKTAPNKIDPVKLKVNKAIGDHILQLRETSKDSGYLIKMRSSMKVLAGLSTKSLEKYLTDHLDLASYRLDAWQTGLAFKRLTEKRKKRARGIYVGAYGWVEDLRPKVEQTIDLSSSLHPVHGGKVIKPKKNAGFVHTPSLNHATAAGVLLAGYKNHATQTNPGNFAINLSSERVRRATYVLQGIQNGQALEALLGYQFERALHDFTTKNNDNNLSKYILELRFHFPMDYASVPQDGSEAQEVIEPYAVVNGLKLTKAKKSDIEKVITNQVHVNLVQKEIDKLDDTLDAINDLMVSEAAYQATQGKTDRTQGLLSALDKAEIPPELEVNKTPRSTHLSITNRVTFHFDPEASAQAGNGWSSIASPRSAMESGLNQWLGKVIGDPSTIFWSASHMDENGNALDSITFSLSDLKLQPIDLLYMIGDDIEAGAKELEFPMVRDYLKSVSIPENNKIKLKFEPEDQDSEKRSLVSVLPLLRNLRRLVTTSHFASAKDFQSASKEKIESPDKLFGWNVDQLKVRIENAFNDLRALRTDLLSIVPNSTQPKGETNPANLEDLFQFYKNHEGSSQYLRKIDLSVDTVEQMLRFFALANLFGIKVQYPDRLDRENKGQMVDFLTSLSGHIKTLNRKIAEAQIKLDEVEALTNENSNKQITRLMEAAKAILGDDFQAIPVFKYTNSSEIQVAIAEGEDEKLLQFINEKQDSPGNLTMESWVQSVARVRPNMGQLEQVCMVAEAQSEATIDFRPLQLPYKENDTWLAVEFPEIDIRTGERFEILDDTICLTVHGEHAKNTNDLQSVLMIDEWTEFIPNNKEISGIAFNYDQPNASAPNALLLAVEPTGNSNWSWETLLGTLEDTLNRAKTRAIEPAQLLEDEALRNLTPMTVANFDLNKSNVSLDFLVTNNEFLAKMKSRNFELYKDFKIED